MSDPYGYREFIDEGHVYLVIMSVLWVVAYIASLFVHSHEHRLDRGAFIGWYMLLLSASGIIILLVVGSFWLLLSFANMEFQLKSLYIAFMILAPMSGWLNGKLITARLRDIGLPKFIGLLMIFPFVNLLALVSLSIMPSHSGADLRWFLSANRL
ncbi:MAG: hypothetical protein QM523_02140 [Candidatus Pacebacteria bacterium]|nr:hypothetical protein [Candidatus Paceibacterota bacterium]